tara:strand:- start:1192 stop:2745 length:1554 start_codon:yes stop_codon:yes gene_type:complete
MTQGAGLFEQDRSENQLGGNGIGVGDVNGDQREDLFLTGNLVNWGAVSNRLYINRGNGIFTEETLERGLPTGVLEVDPSVPAVTDNAPVFADYDNDGDQDLFLVGSTFNKLLRNDNGNFTDVSDSSGFASEGSYSTGLALADYNGDSFLDVLVVNHVPAALEGGGEGQEEEGIADVLYRNNGDGSFSDVSHLLPEPEVPGMGFAASWLDVDRDGDPDLYIVNDEGIELQPNQLYRNDGLGSDGEWQFTNVSASCGCQIPMFGMGTAIGDYDRDGDQDLYLTNLDHGGGEVLLQSQGDGMYIDVTLATSARSGNESNRTTSWGTEFIDIDNDGFLDLFTAFGSLMDPHDQSSIIPAPNVLMRGNGINFQILESSGVESNPATSEGAAAVDYDLDGCMDLVVQNLDGQPALYRNRCEGSGSWVGFRLEGTRSNRDAVGAELRLTAEGITRSAQVFAGSTSVHSGRTKKLHFGLGQSNTIDAIEVAWPSGCLEQFKPPLPGCYYSLREGQGFGGNQACQD